MCHHFMYIHFIMDSFYSGFIDFVPSKKVIDDQTTVLDSCSAAGTVEKQSLCWYKTCLLGKVFWSCTR